jgi:hypothetical protein
VLQIWRVVVAKPLDDEARTLLADSGMLHFATTTSNDGSH